MPGGNPQSGTGKTSNEVEKMTAKTYLKQIRLLDKRIDDGLEELERLNALLTRVTSALGGEVVSGSKDPDKMTVNTDKVIKLRKMLNRLVDKYVDIKQEATELLSQVENPVHYQILHGRYVLYKTWEQIADEIGYTYQWTCQLHGVALLEFEKIMLKNNLLDRN